MDTLQIGLLVFPGITQLDMTGPYEVLSRMSNSRLHLLWKTIDPVVSDRGLTLVPTATLAQSPQMDVILVPGGPGVLSLMEDQVVLAFLRHQAKSARFVASVCTGALVLGAAGLLQGYRATTHWASLEFLSAFGAKPCTDRIVTDQNRVTGGGVTAGIDFALHLAAQLRSEDEARLIQLQMEYNPSPPFHSGHPDVALARTVQAAQDANTNVKASRREVVERVRERLTRAENE
jgi:cyclohexyl-isocyanide hydratase